ncbi:MAG TPA: discoidin domain-containing protein [Anaerohalosphaeraceae bacterium]|nr:discoidin domain-containing protein [Anaerohalosphaeraceae bacterium]HQG04949.1 discoidin domain-containing protein [Anaerohalosphaeraceae bacterium]HQI07484.1 discoidin domain-containing protein [Anaerohalosphaeraceae bacterium]HQJ67616.1 discoidin domain-containing protein [Anaerohalosphaeraceae bacterium]HRU14417.1 discoidin domain-containing protein [Anaerohalosphaeraceae bacterium]
MRNWLRIAGLCIVAASLVGCQKKEPAAPEEPVSSQPANVTLTGEPSEQKAAIEPAAEQSVKLVPIPLTLPKPQFVGTPENITGVRNLEKPLGEPRPPFLAPEGTTLISRGKPVTGSEPEPILGSYDMLTDGDKEASDGSLVELGPFLQWVQVDLEQEYEIYAIVFWQYHKTERVYNDVIVQVSNDPDFIEGVITLFNNDDDNSSGLGVGKDKNFVGTAEGKLIDAKGVRARYVRIYSNGNNQNDMNHFIEIEVFGRTPR